MALRIGDHAPNFTSETTQGPVEFYDWKRGRWAVDIEQTEGVAPNFPVIGDDDGAIARLYDLVRNNPTDTAPMRSGVVIGPDNRIGLMLSDPASTDRNFGEILRAIDTP